MKKFQYLLVIPVLIGLFFSGSTVNAASDWDNIVQPVDNLIYNFPDTTIDITQDWYVEITEALRIRCEDRGQTQYCASYNAIQNMLDGSWAIFKDTYDDGQYTGYILYFTETNSGEYCQFEGTSDLKCYPGSEGKIWIVGSIGNGAAAGNSYQYQTEKGIGIYGAPSQDTNGETVISGENYRYQPFVSTFPITYPSGYEGSEIPDSYNAPDTSTLAPDIFMHNVINYKGEFSDRNYLTTDQVQVLCSPDDLVPGISITLFAGTSALGTPLDTISASASSLFYIDFKQYDPEYGDFTIVAAYTCGEDSEPIFTEHSEYTFTVDQNGYLVNEGFNSCITDTFPFVDFGGCIDNMGYLMNSLSFGGVSFASDWRIEDNGCRTVGTIGDWMGLEGNNRVLCPAFPEDVRNIVTPFVTFMLGVVTLGILLTKTSRGVT